MVVRGAPILGQLAGVAHLLEMRAYYGEYPGSTQMVGTLARCLNLGQLRVIGRRLTVLDAGEVPTAVGDRGGMVSGLLAG